MILILRTTATKQYKYDEGQNMNRDKAPCKYFEVMEGRLYAKANKFRRHMNVVR